MRALACGTRKGTARKGARATQRTLFPHASLRRRSWPFDWASVSLRVPARESNDVAPERHQVLITTTPQEQCLASTASAGRRRAIDEGDHLPSMQTCAWHFSWYIRCVRRDPISTDIAPVTAWEESLRQQCIGWNWRKPYGCAAPDGTLDLRSCVRRAAG